MYQSFACSFYGPLQLDICPVKYHLCNSSPSEALNAENAVDSDGDGVIYRFLLLKKSRGPQPSVSALNIKAAQWIAETRAPMTIFTLRRTTKVMEGATRNTR
jgi:hypothetical protein